MFAGFLAGVMLECFFGVKSEDYKDIDGVSFAKFISNINRDVNLQSYTPLCLLFGPKILKLGLKAHDRDVNRRV